MENDSPGATATTGVAGPEPASREVVGVAPLLRPVWGKLSLP